MNPVRRAVLSILALAVFLGLMTAAIHHFVTSRVAFGTDSYVYWLAARAVFLEGTSPYGSRVAEEAQRGIYGRLAQAGEDHMAFVNPPYSLIPFWPAVWMSYPLAQAFWIAASILALLAAIWLAYPGMPGWLWATVIFLYPVSRGIIMGQLSPLLGAVLILIHGLILRRPQSSTWAPAAAGFSLAWLLVKPQLTWLFVLFFLVTAARDKKWAVWWGFIGGSLAFALLSWWMVPGWPEAWIAQASTHAQNRILQPGVFLWFSWIAEAEVLNWLAGLIAVFGVAATLYFGFSWWVAKADEVVVLAVLALVTLILHPLYLPPEQIILILPLLVWAEAERRRGTASLYLVWGLALLLPWLIFLVSFRGAEPYAVSIWPPALFALWIVWLQLTRPPRSRSARSGFPSFR